MSEAKRQRARARAPWSASDALNFAQSKLDELQGYVDQFRGQVEGEEHLEEILDIIGELADTVKEQLDYIANPPRQTLPRSSTRRTRRSWISHK